MSRTRILFDSGFIADESASAELIERRWRLRETVRQLTAREVIERRERMPAVRPGNRVPPARLWPEHQPRATTEPALKAGGRRFPILHLSAWRSPSGE